MTDYRHVSKAVMDAALKLSDKLKKIHHLKKIKNIKQPQASQWLSLHAQRLHSFCGM
jgi:hypothetical protein